MTNRKSITLQETVPDQVPEPTPPPTPTLTGAPHAKLRLPVDLPLPTALESAFRSVLNYALEEEARAAEDPQRAVHEFRKSLRRLRSLTKLCRPLMGSKRYRTLRDELREPCRKTSVLRDTRVLLETLEGLTPRRKTHTAYHATRAELVAEIEALDRSPQELTVLAEGCARVSPLGEKFTEAVRVVHWRDLEKAVETSYRAARDARSRAKRKGDDPSVHDWRKRTKELRYQLELLSTFPGPTLDETRAQLKEFAQAIGEVTDLMVLHEFVSKLDWQAKKRESKASDVRLRPKRFLREIRHQIDDSLTALSPAAKRFYARKPRRFVREVLSASDH